MLITDNDLAEFTLSFTLTNLAENAGPNATLGTISRGAPSPRSLEIDLQSSTPGVVSLPARVVIASGQSAVSFGVTPVNNTATDGTRTTEIRAFALATQSGERLVPSTRSRSHVADDDGPAPFTDPRQEVGGGGRMPAATTITVSLSLVMNQPVTVHSARACRPRRRFPPPSSFRRTAERAVCPHHPQRPGERGEPRSSSRDRERVCRRVHRDHDLRSRLAGFGGGRAERTRGGRTEAFVNVAHRVANRGFAGGHELDDAPLPVRRSASRERHLSHRLRLQRHRRSGSSSVRRVRFGCPAPALLARRRHRYRTANR